MEENVFYDNKNIQVTDSRFVVGNKTYVLTSITSIMSLKSTSVLMTKILAFSAYIGGFYNLYIAFIHSNELGSFLFGLALLGLGTLFYRVKPTYTLQLDTASGALAVYSSKDKNEINDIVTALNNAIIIKDRKPVK